jgi:hypothetical protein
VASIRIVKRTSNTYAQLVWAIGEQQKTKRIGVMDMTSPTALLDVVLLAPMHLDIDGLFGLRRANKAARW